MNLSILVSLLLFELIDCQRLPHSVKPVHYDLVILPVITGDDPRLCGHVFVDFVTSHTTNVITLNALDLDVVAVSSSNETLFDNRLDRVEQLCFLGIGEDERKSGHTLHVDNERQQLDIIFKAPFQPATKHRLGILYKGKINDEAKGFFRASYTVGNTCCQSWFGGTQMETTHARRVFPCFDEPAFKATFDVTVGHQLRTTALANTLDVSTTPMSLTDDWQWTRYQTSLPLSTYLIAITVTQDYEHVARLYKVCDRKVLLRFWAKPGAVQMTEHMVRAVPDMMRLLEQFFNKSMPVSKIDFVPAPIGFDYSAMENHGLVLFREDTYYYDDRATTLNTLYNIAQTFAHELLHHYIGNLVTADWWDDIWFVEGLSGTFEEALVKQVLPGLDKEADVTWMGDFYGTMLHEDTEDARPAISYQEEPAKLDALFDSIAYGKSKILLSSVANFVGFEAFSRGVVAFLNQYEYKTANSSHFWRILDAEVRRQGHMGREFSVAKIMDSWTRQASYPIVECKMTDDGRLSLAQRPFPGASSRNPYSTWWIPITIDDEKSIAQSLPAAKYPRLWLTPDRPLLRVAPTRSAKTNETWIVVNAEGYAYFRVEYDERNWEMIAQQLIRDHTVLPRRTRIQLIDDAFIFATFNIVPYEIPFKLVRYLKKRQDEFVLQRVMYYFDVLKQLLKHNDTMVSLIETYTYQLTHIGLEDIDTNDLASRSNRVFSNETLSETLCRQENQMCIYQAIRLYEGAMANDLKPDEQRFMMKSLEWIWCTAIRFGGEKHWRFAWKASTDPELLGVRGEILSALSCTKHERNAKSLLSRIYHPDIAQRPSHTYKMMEGMSRYSSSRSLTIKFLTSNWEFLEKHFGSSKRNLKLLGTLTKYDGTNDDLNKLNRLFSAKGINEKSSIAASIIRSVKKNTEWIKSKSSGFAQSLAAELTAAIN